ncbi:MAG TPA: hypothetical protein DCZ03_03550 [Gammaproteobacteria bacterium]|nr:hypothetical protein [Gammaproteobacteria bacterium]
MISWVSFYQFVEVRSVRRANWRIASKLLKYLLLKVLIFIHGREYNELVFLMKLPLISVGL